MADREIAYLKDILQAIAERSRSLFGLAEDSPTEAQSSPEFLSRALLSTRGEASGVALARAIVECWQQMDAPARCAWFEFLAEEFGPNADEMTTAIANWKTDPSPATSARVYAAFEPKRQELFRRINLAPGGTATLVKMREFLLEQITGSPDLAIVDEDFAHLFASWFNRGFLELRPINWSSPAEVLARIMHYEAVHEIKDWEDLRRRLEPRDRRCFAFFHPQMQNQPLIFVEVALTRGTPVQIGAVLAGDRQPIEDIEADTAVFYSISNTQTGLKNISFGNFLIKQVVEELLRELPNLKNFVTLSPLPGFSRWLAREAENPEPGEFDRIIDPLRVALQTPDWQNSAQDQALVQPLLISAAAVYLLEAKNKNGEPADPVARFHLRNGAILDRINFCADTSQKGMGQAHGTMVNYLYNLDAIERNHELYANNGGVAASKRVKRLLRH